VGELGPDRVADGRPGLESRPSMKFLVLVGAGVVFLLIVGALVVFPLMQIKGFKIFRRRF
jgi:hypothetical protein